MPSKCRLMAAERAGQRARIVCRWVAGRHQSLPLRHAPSSQAIVDDLRAEIASSRAELQQLRMAVQASAELN